MGEDRTVEIYTKGMTLRFDSMDANTRDLLLNAFKNGGQRTITLTMETEDGRREMALRLASIDRIDVLG